MGAVFNQTRQHIGLAACNLLTTHCFLPLWPDYTVEKQLKYGLQQKLLIYSTKKNNAFWMFVCGLRLHFNV